MDLIHCATCPEHPKLEVLESRHRAYGDTRTTHRRRACPVCNARVSTIEVPATMARDLFLED